MAGELMGSTIGTVSPESAATMLGVTRVQVYRLVRSGAIPRASGNLRQNIRLRISDVQAYLDAKVSRATVPDLRRELVVERALRVGLEKRLELVERMLRIHSPITRYDEPKVLELLERARDAMKNPPTKALDILEWCEVFFGVHEELFDLIEAYTGNPDPWTPLLALAENMQKNCPVDLHDEEVMAAYTELSAARRALRQTVFVYVNKGRKRGEAERVIPEVSGDIIKFINSCVHR